MLGFPKSTEFYRRIPKQKFYENLNISPALKRVFVEQVKSIYWKNQIATSTTNLKEGSKVTEIEVFEIKLNNAELSEQLLRQIDKEIPYHILFLLSKEDKYQVWIGYKEASTGNNTFKVNSYYHTDWCTEDGLSVKLDGLNLDTVYENFVRQIAGDKLSAVCSEESLKDSVEREEARSKLASQIAKLEKQVRSEVQPNKKFELVKRGEAYKKQLEEM